MLQKSWFSNWTGPTANSADITSSRFYWTFAFQVLAGSHIFCIRQGMLQVHGHEQACFVSSSVLLGRLCLPLCGFRGLCGSLQERETRVPRPDAPKWGKNHRCELSCLFSQEIIWTTGGENLEKRSPPNGTGMKIEFPSFTFFSPPSSLSLYVCALFPNSFLLVSQVLLMKVVPLFLSIICLHTALSNLQADMVLSTEQSAWERKTDHVM